MSKGSITLCTGIVELCRSWAVTRPLVAAVTLARPTTHGTSVHVCMADDLVRDEIVS